MKGRVVTLYIAVVLTAGSVGISLYYSSLNRALEKHCNDLAISQKDIFARREGCRLALEDMDKFKNHVGGYLLEKEEEIGQLKEEITGIRRRMGNVEKIREEYEKLEHELDEVNKILETISGMKGARRP